MFWDDEFALEEYDYDGWSIWSELSETIDLWRRTYEEYWGLGDSPKPKSFSDEQHSAYQQQYGNAETIMRMATALTLNINRDKPLKLTQSHVKAVRDFLRAHQESPVVRDRIALSLAAQAAERINKGEERAFRLIGLLLGRPLGVRASSYITRATTLYVEGLPIETLIMCRAALEAALIDALAEGINEDEDPPPLYKLIEAAGRAGFLDGFLARDHNSWRAKSESSLWRALRVKRAGDFVAHSFPRFPAESGEIADAFDAIRDLSIVLSRLFPDATFE